MKLYNFSRFTACYWSIRLLKYCKSRVPKIVIWTTCYLHPRLSGLTSAQHRRRTKLRKLPFNYVIPHEPLSIAAGRVTFFRQVTAHGNIHLLSQTFFVGKRLKGEYVKATLDTQRAHLTVYHHGRIFKRFPYPFLKK